MSESHPIPFARPMEPAQYPMRAEGLQWCTMGEGGLINDTDDGRSWVLNPVGLFIWDHCDGSRDLDDIEADMCAAFGIDVATARHDLQGFLYEMENLGLVLLSYPLAS